MHVEINHDPVKNALKITVANGDPLKVPQSPIQMAMLKHLQTKVPTDKRGIPFQHPTQVHAGGA